MTKKNTDPKQLTEHYFRKEYGKLVSVITKYIGINNIQTAEDIVQETLLKAVDNWQVNGIPTNPQAWLYTTAKNSALNIIKRNKNEKEYTNVLYKNTFETSTFEISEDSIIDEQLKMMFVCCNDIISENTKIALILKILCGFSITEIANAFFTTNETINKRLVRGRKQFRENNIQLEIPKNTSTKIPIILKTIYLLFNEGYSPTQKNEILRYDLCLEAIRLTRILIDSKEIVDKADCYALLALMYFNVSRFNARIDENNLSIELEKQNRSKWDQNLINEGIYNLTAATKNNKLSKYHILAAISANYSIAPSFKKTNWTEILSLYNNLLQFENSPTVRLNRSIVLAKVEGNKIAIEELLKIAKTSDITKHPLFHATIAELYKGENENSKAIKHLRKAILLTKSKRDLLLLEKKLLEFVPNSKS